MRLKMNLLLALLLPILFIHSAFSQLTMPSNRVELQTTSGYALYYEFNNEAKTVQFGLDINRDADYIGVGFAGASSFGMAGFDIAAFIFTPSTTQGQYNCQIRDLFAGENGQPPADTLLGGTSDYTLINFYAVTGRRQVLFERPMNTGDQYDYPFDISQNGVNIAISWAWLANGRGTLAYHGGVNRGTIYAPLSYPEETSVEEAPVEEAPVEETAPIEETAPVEEVPVEEAPVEEISEETPSDAENNEENPQSESEEMESLVPLVFPPSSTNFSADLTFYYEFLEDTNTVRMGLEINKDVDYFAVGFSDEANWGMTNFDIVAFVFKPSLTASSTFAVDVLDLYSTETSQPPTDTSLGGTSDYKIVKYYIGDNRRQVLFERPYDTGDSFDHKFDPELSPAKTAVSWAWSMIGQPGLSYHQGNRGTVLLAMYPGDDENQNPGGPTNPTTGNDKTKSDVPLTFPPSKVTIAESGMVMYFDFNDANKMITMGLEIGRPVDFFGIGFADEGNSGMTNFDMVAFVFAKGQVNTLDMYSTADSRPPSDSALGGSNDYKLVSYYLDGDKTQVLFQRAFDTGDAFDYTFDSSNSRKNIAVSWAWLSNGAGIMDYHGRQNRGTILTQMYNGLVGVGKDYYSGINTNLFFKFHGYLSLFMWGLLIDVAIWIARYRKSSKNHVTLHLGLSGLIYAGTVILTAIALKLRASGVEGSLYEAHLALGIIILILSTLQVIGGFIYRHKMVSTKTTKRLPRLNLMHKILGIVTYLIAKIQLIIGLQIFQPKYMGILLAVYAILAVLWVAHGYFFRFTDIFKRRKPKVIPENSYKSEQHKALMAMLNDKTPVSQILQAPELQKLKWCILDNQVFQLNGFTHPGGNFITSQVQGREVGRFIYGVAGLESFTGQSKQTHSSQAYSYIRKNYIGTIMTNYKIFSPTSLKKQINPDPHTNPERQLPMPIANNNQTWALLQKINLSEHTSKFVFKSDKFEVNEWSEDIRDLGKHLRVSHVSHQKVRLYTLVLSQINARIQRRQLLLERTKDSAKLAEALVKNSSVRTIPLIVKNYDAPTENTFSSFLHSCPENTDGFQIEGPYGTGFGLTLESTGVHYIFAAGTGILPFLDLFDFLLESLLDPNRENCNLLKNGFKLKIFASFRTIDDFVGLDIVENLIKISREAGLEDAVEMVIRCSDAKGSQLYSVSYENFDQEFISKNVDPNSEKLFICGPPGFNNTVPSELQNIGIPMSKIMLV